MVPLPSYNYERIANLKFGAESVKEEEGDIMLQILLTFTPTDSCKSGVHSGSNKLSARCINPMIQSFPDCGCTNNIKLELPSNFLECQEKGGLFLQKKKNSMNKNKMRTKNCNKKFQISKMVVVLSFLLQPEVSFYIQRDRER